MYLAGSCPPVMVRCSWIWGRRRWDVCVFWFQKGFGNDKTGQVRLAASILSTSWATIKVSWQKVKMFDAAEWGIQRFVVEGETDTVDQTESSWA
jgi:hypothetical protein